MVTITLEIDTLIITIFESFGTLSKEAFTFGTVVAALAVSDSGPVFIASTGIFDTDFVLTR